MASQPQSHARNQMNSAWFNKQLTLFASTALVTLFTTMLVSVFLIPFVYSALTSIKDRDQIVASARGNILPVDPVTFTYEGEELQIFFVPLEEGIRQLALLERSRQNSTFIDPNNPDGELIEWEGSWRTLERVTAFAPRWGNFGAVWNEINFPLLVRNTLAIAIIGVIGTLLSSISVAYAFARFPLPYKRTLFFILISTIILPTQVTLIPTYTLYSRIGWVGSWLPLLVPHFFANAYNVFLIRQYFLTLPKELDEAAMIDGAGPLRILISVIIPQSWPVIVAVGLFHMVFAWNDYFAPLIYLLGKPELIPISIGIQNFNFQFGTRPHLIQATALMGMIFPVLVFFFAQKVFMRGVVITGVEK